MQYEKLFRKAAVLVAAATVIAGAGSAQTLSLDPPSVTFDSCANHSVQTVQVTSASPTAFSIASPATWFNVSFNSTTTPATLVLMLRETFTTNTVAGVDLNIGGATDATLTVNWSSAPCTSGGGGGGGGGTTFTVTPSPAGTGANTMALTSSSPSGTLALANGTANSVQYTVTATPAAWLSAAPSSGSVQAGGTGSVTVTANPAGLTPGAAARGTVTVTPTDPQIAPVRISVSFGGSGASLTVNGTANSIVTIPLTYTSGTGIPGAQQVAVQSSSDATTFTVTSVSTAGNSGNWLAAGGPSGISTSATGPYPDSGGVWIGLTSVAAGLLGGAYQGSVVLTSADGSIATINIALTVSGGTAAVTASPASYQFVAPVANNGTLQAIFRVTGATGVTLGSPSATSDLNWLSVSAPSGSSADTLYAFASSAGLADGTYNGTIRIPSNGPSGSITATVPVTLIVGTATGGTSATAILPDSLNFWYQVNPAVVTGLTQLISVTGSRGGTFSASSDQPWIQVFPASITSPDTLHVTINPIGMAPGSSYSGNVTVTGPAGPTTVPVSLTVTATGTPVLEPHATADLVFSASTAGTLPAPQNLVIYTSDGTAPGVSVSSNSTWLTAIAAADGKTVTISTDPTGLGTGAYSGTVTVSASGSYSNGPLAIPVVLAVNGGGVPGPLTVGSLSAFSATLNGPPQTQTLTVDAATPATFTASASGQPGDWLSISPNGSGATPQSLTVSANPAGLPAGT
jgi:hypothetical protein